jgi:kinesin family protein 18/19
MMGNSRSDEAAGGVDAGIIPNALVDLFDLIYERRADASHGEEWSIVVSFIEVYNEQVYDLLEPTGRILQVREDQEKGVVVVAGVTERTAESAYDVLALLNDGNMNRKTEATMANQVSSRSHAVLQVTLKHSRKTAAGKQVNIESKLSLIDLAGSERASATNNRGARLQEGANINKSLLALANCINALAAGNSSGKKQNVKYRDSKLTHLLKSSLEGQCNLIMIANINPSHHTYEDR